MEPDAWTTGPGPMVRGPSSRQNHVLLWHKIVLHTYRKQHTHNQYIYCVVIYNDPFKPIMKAHIHIQDIIYTPKFFFNSGERKRKREKREKAKREGREGKGRRREGEGKKGREERRTGRGRRGEKRREKEEREEEERGLRNLAKQKLRNL
jgi:hypothetical protein